MGLSKNIELFVEGLFGPSLLYGKFFLQGLQKQLRGFGKDLILFPG